MKKKSLYRAVSVSNIEAMELGEKVTGFLVLYNFADYPALIWDLLKCIQQLNSLSCLIFSLCLAHMWKPEENHQAEIFGKEKGSKDEPLANVHSFLLYRN